MSVKQKLGFLALAIVCMIGLASASLFMANGYGWYATLDFVVSFLLIFIGFLVRRKIFKRLNS